MKDLRANISRILQVEEATDMEAALFILCQMDLAATIGGGSQSPEAMPVLHVARVFLRELDNPFARKLLADKLAELTNGGPERERRPVIPAGPPGKSP